MPGDAEYHTL